VVNPPRNQADSPNDFEPWELDLIRNLVLDFLSTRTESPGFEADDLIQECSLHWWRQRAEFDIERGASRSTFLRRVVRAKLRDIERAWKARKRGEGQRRLSLDAPASPDDSDAPTLAEVLPARGDLGSDIAAALDRQRLTTHLSARQREIIAGVLAGLTKNELSSRLGVSRDTLYEDVKRIRQVFRDEGLAPHLD
jgi:RNA polymerase sigma-70 factor (ECF subfamily)